MFKESDFPDGALVNHDMFGVGYISGQWFDDDGRRNVKVRFEAGRRKGEELNCSVNFLIPISLQYYMRAVEAENTDTPAVSASEQYGKCDYASNLHKKVQSCKNWVSEADSKVASDPGTDTPPENTPVLGWYQGGTIAPTNYVIPEGVDHDHVIIGGVKLSAMLDQANANGWNEQRAQDDKEQAQIAKLNNQLLNELYHDRARLEKQVETLKAIAKLSSYYLRYEIDKEELGSREAEFLASVIAGLDVASQL